MEERMDRYLMFFNVEGVLSYPFVAYAFFESEHSEQVLRDEAEEKRKGIEDDYRENAGNKSLVRVEMFTLYKVEKVI